MFWPSCPQASLSHTAETLPRVIPRDMSHQGARTHLRRWPVEPTAPGCRGPLAQGPPSPSLQPETEGLEAKTQTETTLPPLPGSGRHSGVPPSFRSSCRALEEPRRARRVLPPGPPKQPQRRECGAQATTGRTPDVPQTAGSPLRSTCWVPWRCQLADGKLSHRTAQ